MTFNIHNFLAKFNENYNWLTGNPAISDDEYHSLIDEGDRFIEKEPDFVRDFILFRQDYLSSDREIAAFMLTLYDFADGLAK